MKPFFTHPHFILMRQGISDTQRTSENCELFSTPHHVQVHRYLNKKKEEYFEAACGKFRSRSATIEEIRAGLAVHLSDVFGRPVKFYDFTERYGTGFDSYPGRSDKYFVFCDYEAATETIRLHRSNVCLVSFEKDGKTTCGGTPVVFKDGANKAYRPLITSAIKSVIGQNCRSNNREWLCWLISAYIHSNVTQKFWHGDHTPRFDGVPVFDVDFTPSVRDNHNRPTRA